MYTACAVNSSAGATGARRQRREKPRHERAVSNTGLQAAATAMRSCKQTFSSNLDVAIALTIRSICESDYRLNGASGDRGSERRAT